VALALQGGGALGAFTWGVLERLLDAPRLGIELVSGTSAGAMNAALLVQGLATGGPAEARRLLETFWRRVAVAAGSPDLDGTEWLAWLGGLTGPVTEALRHLAQGLSPAQLNPLGRNPLADVLDGLLDPDAFGRPGAPGLIVAATRVRTGEARLFRDAEVTADVLLASACLPQLFPPVAIAGELYWDGGYASNPPVRPLLLAPEAPADVIIVRTTPEVRPAPPRSGAEVRERAAEIAFGTALHQELRSIATAQQLLRAELPANAARPDSTLARLRAARLHMIGAEAALQALPPGSALDVRWGALQRLRALGHTAAEAWLATHHSALGVRSTLDLTAFAGAAE
jgi:NTE family protein